MKVIDVDNLNVAEYQGRITRFTGGTSIRPLLARDGMGFSLHKTMVDKGGPYHWHYPNHLEACYCISGEGELTDLETGNKYVIVPGVMYVLDNHDNHTFEAFEDTVLISVFNPPVIGGEKHDENGVYPMSEYTMTMANKIVKSLRDVKNDYDAKEAIINILTNTNV
jgi:L-ectoine synthase